MSDAYVSKKLNNILAILFESQAGKTQKKSKVLVAQAIEAIFAWSKELEVEVDDIRLTDRETGWDRFGVARDGELLAGQCEAVQACSLVLYNRLCKGDTKTLNDLRDIAVALYKTALPPQGDKLPYIIEIMIQAQVLILEQMRKEYFKADGLLKPEYAVWTKEED